LITALSGGTSDWNARSSSKVGDYKRGDHEPRERAGAPLSSTSALAGKSAAGTKGLTRSIAACVPASLAEPRSLGHASARRAYAIFELREREYRAD
jgi:hypothetical protein